MKSHEYEQYIQAGRIAARVRDETVKKVKHGVSLLEIAESVEMRITELGGKPAFPCNLSLNETASHFTPLNDSLCFNEGDVVKLDIGVHIDGYIADTAVTIEVGNKQKHKDIINTAHDAVANAIDIIKAGVNTGNIGEVIEKTIVSKGYRAIYDLTGHSLRRYNLHAGITIPNYRSSYSKSIEEGSVFAVEPFLTYGDGTITRSEPSIFKTRHPMFPSSEQKRMISFLERRFNSLPFAERWLDTSYFDMIKQLKLISGYPVLIESDGEIVAQSEHTVIVEKEGCEVITI